MRDSQQQDQPIVKWEVALIVFLAMGIFVAILCAVAFGPEVHPKTTIRDGIAEVQRMLEDLEHAQSIGRETEFLASMQRIAERASHAEGRADGYLNEAYDVMESNGIDDPDLLTVLGIAFRFAFEDGDDDAVKVLAWPLTRTYSIATSAEQQR